MNSLHVGVGMFYVRSFLKNILWMLFQFLSKIFMDRCCEILRWICLTRFLPCLGRESNSAKFSQPACVTSEIITIYKYTHIYIYICPYLTLVRMKAHLLVHPNNLPEQYLSFSVFYVVKLFFLLLTRISSDWLKRFFTEFHFHLHCCLWLNPLALESLQSLIFLSSRNLNVSWILFKGRIILKHV